MAELARLQVGATEIHLRESTQRDLPAMVCLLADDRLGARRETVDPQDVTAYADAFRAIDADPAHLLVVAEDDSQLVAMMQLSFLPGLAHRGAWRAQIESVRVASGFRGRGLGRAMIEWALGEARRRGCAIVQLTSHGQRPDAHRFYEQLGFVASHRGFKLALARE